MGFVGTNISDRNDAQVCSRQGKRRGLKGYNTREIHVFVDDDTSDEELPAKVKYAVIVQEEAFIPDDDFFSEQKSK